MKTIIFIVTLTFMLLNMSAQSTVKPVVFKLHTQDIEVATSVAHELNAPINAVFPYHLEQHQKGNSTPLSGIFVTVPRSEAHRQQIFKILLSHPGVVYAESKPEVRLFEVPNDPSVTAQYYLGQINIFDAWDICNGDSAVVIGIVDTGTDFTHEDMNGKIALNHDDPVNGIDDDADGFVDNYHGWDLSENNNNPQADVNGHGVRVAGIAAAATNNDTGIAGVGYKIRYLPVKTMNSLGQLNTAWEGIVYAADHGADVIVCSWGGVVESPFGHDIVRYAVQEKDVVVVAAAGNSSNEDIYYPAAYPEVISVAATNENDQKWSGSTYGYHIDIAAPGEKIYATTLGSGYGNGWGTSFAAPAVGAVAALVRHQRPHLSAQQVRQQVINTTYLLDTIPQNVIYADKLGSGRLDAYEALTDTMISGLAIDQMQTVGSLSAGDTAYIEGAFENYLKSAEIEIQIESLSDFASVLTSSLDVGVLNTGDSYIISKPMLPVKLHTDIPFDHQVTLKFTIDDGQKNYARYFTFRTHRSWINLTHNNLNMTVPANGRLGFNQLSPLQGNGIWLNDKRNMVWEAGLIYGAGTNNVISTFLNATSLHIMSGADTADVGDSLLRVRSVMVDTNKANAMEIITKQRVTSVQTATLENVLMVEWLFINAGGESYTDFHAGVYFDWDLVSATYNSMFFDEARAIAFCRNNYGDNRFVGIKIYDRPFHHYALDLTEDAEGINVLDGFTDEERWFALSNQRNEAGAGNLGNDVAHIVSAGGFALNTGDTASLQMIIAAGYHQETVAGYIAEAAEYLNQSTALPKLDAQVAKIYPIPAKEHVRIEYSAFIEKLTVVNLAGTKMLEQRVHGKNVSLNLGNVPAGLYILKSRTSSGKILSSKILITD